MADAPSRPFSYGVDVEAGEFDGCRAYGYPWMSDGEEAE